MVITDHLNLTGQSPLIGPNDDQLGPRFPDMTEAYSARLREAAFAAAQQAGVDLRQGIYAWMTGPTYETPAEIRMAATLGADLVGMSTVPETIALRHMDREVLGLSLVTNMAAGMSDSPLSHGEVQQTAQTAAARFTRLLDHLLPDLVSQSPIPSDQ